MKTPILITLISIVFLSQSCKNKLKESSNTEYSIEYIEFNIKDTLVTSNSDEQDIFTIPPPPPVLGDPPVVEPLKQP